MHNEDARYRGSSKQMHRYYSLHGSTGYSYAAERRAHLWHAVAYFTCANIKVLWCQLSLGQGICCSSISSIWLERAVVGLTQQHLLVPVRDKFQSTSWRNRRCVLSGDEPCLTCTATVRDNIYSNFALIEAQVNNSTNTIQKTRNRHTFGAYKDDQILVHVDHNTFQQTYFKMNLIAGLSLWSVQQRRLPEDGHHQLRP